MSAQGIGQILFCAVILTALGYPLGLWMAKVYGSFRTPRVLAATERGLAIRKTETRL